MEPALLAAWLRSSAVSLYDSLALPSARELATSLFVRGLAANLTIALLSYAPQAAGLIGPRGLSPARAYLRRYVRDFGRARAVAYFPTLFWLTGASAAAVTLVPLLGGLAALLVACGDAVAAQLLRVAAAVQLPAPLAGPLAALLHGVPAALSGLSPALLAFAWACLLSLDFGRGAHWYPWDSLLLEASFLGLFLPPLVYIGGVGGSAGGLLAAARVADPLLLFAFRLLVARLLMGFGKLKFAGAHASRDQLYIRPFLHYQPLPSKPGFLAASVLPDAAMRALLAGMFVAELLAPPLLFLPGWPRLVAALLIVQLMAGIMLTGNFGHFNVLTATLCIPSCLAPGGSVFDAGALPPSPLFAAVFLLYLMPGSLLYFFTNSWVSLAWAHWPTLARLPPGWLLRDFMSLLRALAPLRALHGYGIFFPTTGTPQRLAPVFEGSDDGGRTWRPFAFRVFPSGAAQAPSTVAPHHPRLDHAVFYAAYGTDWHNLGAPIGRPSPHSFAPGGATQWARLQRALAEGPARRPELLALLAQPLPQFAGGGPPRLVRASMLHLQPASPAHLRATGHWWRVERLGTFLAPIAAASEAGAAEAGAGCGGSAGRGEAEGDDDDEDAAPSGAESFSWDAAVWRARAQAAGARDCILSKADYELAWEFIGDVRALAYASAERRARGAGAAPLAEACRAMPPAAEGARGVPALQVFDSAHLRAAPRALASAAVAGPPAEALALAEADAAFLLGALPGVVAALYGGEAQPHREGRAYSALELRRVRRALASMSLPVLRACERLFGGAPPGEASLRAEWAAAEAAGGPPCATWQEFALLPTMVEGAPRSPGEPEGAAAAVAAAAAAGAAPSAPGAVKGPSAAAQAAAPAAASAVTLNGVRYPVTTFAGNDDAGASGCARSHFRFGMYAHWLMLVGGRRALEALAGGEAALVGRAIPFANAPGLADPVALRSRPALMHALTFAAPGQASRLGPAHMATEAGLFLLGCASFALFAPSVISARLLVAQSRLEPERPKASLSPLPGVAELGPRLAAHPEVARLWCALEKRLLPAYTLPLWVEAEGAAKGGGIEWRHVGWWGR